MTYLGLAETKLTRGQRHIAKIQHGREPKEEAESGLHWSSWTSDEWGDSRHAKSRWDTGGSEKGSWEDNLRFFILLAMDASGLSIIGQYSLKQSWWTVIPVSMGQKTVEWCKSSCMSMPSLLSCSAVLSLVEIMSAGSQAWCSLWNWSLAL